MNARDDLRTPLKRALGLGSAKSGTGHFIWQRVTAIALVLLGAYLVGLLFSLGGSDFARAYATVANPLNATMLVGFLVGMFWHAKLGMQVVIEDYVHTAWIEWTLHMLNKFVWLLAGLASVVAIGRIAFGA